MRLVKSFLIIAAGFFLLLAAEAFGISKGKSKTPQVSISNQTQPSGGFSKAKWRVFTEDEPVLSVPSSRIANFSISQSVSPYILMHTGAREADNNGAWKRHAVKDTCGNLHVLYGIFDGNPTTNNRYGYNCLAAGADTMTYPPGSEPHANPAQSDHNGGIDVLPSCRAVWVGRGLGSNTGSLFSVNFISCGDLIATGTVSTDASRPLDPAIYVVSESTWVVIMANFNAAATISSSRTTDFGATWSALIPCISSSFLNFAVTGKGNVVHVFSMGLSDSSAGDDVEEILHVISTDAGASWSPSISVSGPFELPTYIPQFNGSITAIMVGDTAHCIWGDHTHDSGILPGGHIHHLAVEPSGAIQGPHKVADIKLYYNVRYDYSTTGFGLGHGLWCGGSGPTAAYNASTKILYALWGAPPEDPLNPGVPSDTTIIINGHTYGNNDIWCAVSATNGRNWDVKTNVTATNHPGCDGTTNPCEHEFYISAAAEADSVVYVVTQVQKQPGFFALGEVGLADTRLSDEWRLYLIPARSVKTTASCKLIVTSNDNLSALAVSPGGAEAVTFEVTNTGLADLRLDSIVFTGNLNDGNLVSIRTNGVNIGDPIPQLTSASLTITFDASGVSYAQAGLRSGQVQIWTHTDDTVGLMGSQVAVCSLGVNVYVVPKLCLNSADTIHSASNFTEIWSQSVEVFAASVNGMFYFATGENFIFDGGIAICSPALAGPPSHPRGLRNYFDDQFLRCLSPIVVDSVPDPTDPANSYQIFAKTLSTGRFDSTIVWETIWEQSTNPAYSDFLSITHRVVNISDADIVDVILGHTNDIDVPTGYILDDVFLGVKNLSYDTTFTAASDGKEYRMLVLSGVDTTGESGTPPPHFCTPNNKYFGVLTIPEGTASISPVQARGAVAHNNNVFVLGNQWVDSIFCRNMDATGYHTGRNLGDPYTGMDTVYVLDSCPNGGAADLGYTVGVKKVTLPKNTVVKDLLIRSGGGLSGLAAGLDTLTLPGPTESYTVIMVASLNGISDLITNADAAVSYFNLTANSQLGGDFLFHRGDCDNNGILTSSDVVRELNKVFLGIPSFDASGQRVIECVFDLDLNGIFTAADVVRLLGYTFRGTIYPGYPNRPDLLGCL